MIKAVSAAALLLAVCQPAKLAFGQAPPAITYDAPSAGFSVPLAGQFTYALNAGETAYVNYAGAGVSGGTAYSTQVGGSVGLLTSSESHPFSLLYGGGITLFTGSQGSSLYYQSLDISQQFIYQKWTFTAEDSLRITPDLPLGGVSGTAGAGDLGTGPAGGSGAGLLTPNQTRLNEIAQGSASRALNGATSLSFGGSYSFLRTPGQSYGVDSNTVGGSASLDRHLNARDEISATYSYQHTGQGSTGFTIDTHSAIANITHAISPSWTVSAGAGPQYFISTYSGVSSSALSYSAQGSLDHSFQFSTFSVSFDREIRNTASVGASAETTRAGLTWSRSFSPLTRASVNMSYLRTESLPGIINSYAYTSDGYYVGAQLNRSIGRLWSAYISYTLEDQNVAGTAGGLTPLQGFQHLVGFGFSFAPLPITLHGH